MKNIRNILAKGVFMLLVSLLAMACTEKSDWGIDASYSRPFGTNEDGINVTKDEKVAVVLSGGNIDVNTLSLIIEKGLAKSNRKIKLVITLIDKPGSLMELTGIFKDTAANIVSIDYDRTASNLAYGDANIIITLESKGKEHQEAIKDALREKKFKFSVVE